MNDLQVNKNNNIATADLIAERKKALDTFLVSIDIKDTTRTAYKKGITYFFNYLAQNNITEITQQTAQDYKKYLVNHNEATSINLYLTALKRFYKYLNTHYDIADITAELRLEPLKREHKKDGLNLTQVKELLTATENKRDKAIITMFLTGAFRTIELERANIEDLTIKGNNYILKVQGKGHDKKDDYIPLKENTYKIICEYLATRKNKKASEPLFTSDSNNKNGGRLTTRSIRRIVKNNLKNIGIDTPRITTHSLRHTAITQFLLNNDKNIFEAQKFARHINPTTTQIYIDEMADDEAKQKATDTLERIFFN